MEITKLRITNGEPWTMDHGLWTAKFIAAFLCLCITLAQSNIALAAKPEKLFRLVRANQTAVIPALKEPFPMPAVLRKVEDPNPARRHIEKFREENNYANRLKAQDELVKMAETAEFLITALDDKDPYVRSWSALTLGKLSARAGRALDKLDELSENDPDPGVRNIARYAHDEISAIIQPDRTGTFAKIFAAFFETLFAVITAPFNFLISIVKSSHTHKRRAALPRCDRVKTLVERFKETVPADRDNAAKELAAMGDSAILPLIKASMDSDAQVRKHAHWTLARMNTEDAAATLRQLLGGRDPLVRRITREGQSRANELIAEIKNEFGIKITEREARPFYIEELTVFKNLLEAIPRRLLNGIKTIETSSETSEGGSYLNTFKLIRVTVDYDYAIPKLIFPHEIGHSIHFMFDDDDAAVWLPFKELHKVSGDERANYATNYGYKKRSESEPMDDFASCMERWLADSKEALRLAVDTAKNQGKIVLLKKYILISKLFAHDGADGKRYTYAYEVNNNATVTRTSLLIVTDSQNRLIRIGNFRIDPSWDVKFRADSPSMKTSLPAANVGARHAVPLLHASSGVPSEEEKRIGLLIGKLGGKVNHTDRDRSAASSELVKIGKPAVEPIMKALGDADVFVRGWSAWTLGKMGADSDPALKELERLSRDDAEPGVRYIAQNAHEDISSAVEKTKPASFFQAVFNIITAPFRFAFAVIKFIWTFNYAGFIGLTVGIFEGGAPYIGPGGAIVFMIPVDSKDGRKDKAFGNVTLNHYKDGKEKKQDLRHESAHVWQYTIYGPLFPPLYALIYIFTGHDSHPFEAGLIERDNAITAVLGDELVSVEELVKSGFLKKFW